jgi:hypothetical protein
MNESGGDLMRFYTNQHPLYWGIDLHARSMYVCLVSQDGEILLHHNMQAAPEPLLTAVAPYRNGLVVAVAGIFTWYGLADLCADHNMPLVLGHALSLQAIHGGKANNDQIDSHQMAARLRGARLPQASVSPAAMRATRDLLRRRMHRMRQRAALFSPVHTTTSQDNLPESGKTIASKATRAGVAARLPDPAVPKPIAVDLALIPSDDELLRALALSLTQTAKHHDAHPLSL